MSEDLLSYVLPFFPQFVLLNHLVYYNQRWDLDFRLGCYHAET